MIGLECGVLFVARAISLRVAINVLRPFPRRKRVHGCIVARDRPYPVTGRLVCEHANITEGKDVDFCSDVVGLDLLLLFVFFLAGELTQKAQQVFQECISLTTP